MAGLLSITFRGPFVFSFPALSTGNVDVYAPKCDGHFAGIFWTDNACPVTGLDSQGGNHTYAIAGNGIAPSAGALSLLGAAVVSVASGVPAAAKASFHLAVPRPKIVYGILPEQSEIVGKNFSSPTGVLSSYATGVRFYYDWDGTEVSLSRPAYTHPKTGRTSAPPNQDITPPYGDPLPQFGDIEVQYGGPKSSDSDHLDAIACFKQIADLAGVPWWLSYYDAGGSGASVRTAVDCIAFPLLFGI